VAIAAERYFVMGWPQAAGTHFTHARCRMYSLGIFAFACLYQLQRLIFPQKRIEIDDSILAENCPHLLPADEINKEEEELGVDDDYEQYFFRWPYMTFMMAIPTVLLILLNSFIWLEVIYCIHFIQG